MCTGCFYKSTVREPCVMRIPEHTSAENLPLDLDSAAPGEYDETWFEQNLMRIDLAFRHMFEAQGG